MAQTIVDDELWQEFHRVVNMTSRELRDWLAVQGAGEDAEQEPDRAGSHLGHRVLAILGKRRADLTPDDVHTFLATIGRSSKRADRLAEQRGDYIGQFGIGLLSCFLVADERGYRR